MSETDKVFANVTIGYNDYSDTSIWFGTVQLYQDVRYNQISGILHAKS